MQAVEQSAIGVLLINCVIGMDCRRRWDVNVRHYVTPCRSYRVRSSLKHNDKSDFCKLFLIEFRFVNNFATAGINIKFSKQHSVL